MKSWHRISLDQQSCVRESKQAIREHINLRLRAPESDLLAAVGGAAAPADSVCVTIPEPEPEPEEQVLLAQPHVSAAFEFQCCEEARVHFETLVQQSAGNFLYAVTALDDIETGSTLLQDVRRLPTRLHDLYEHFFERLFGEDTEHYRVVRPVFETVQASYNGVTHSAILQCLRVSDPTADDEVLSERLKSVKQFLREQPSQYDGGEPALVFYHLAFGEWLQSPEHAYGIDESRGHRALAVVMFCIHAARATACAEAFVSAVVEQLDCDSSLQAKHVRKMRAALQTKGSAGRVYDLARHLGEAIESFGGDVTAFGALLQEGGVQVEEVNQFEGHILRGNGCLAEAAYDGELATIPLLTASSAAVDSADERGWTPLLNAAQNGHESVVSALVSAGATVDQAEEGGAGPS
jgi:hypothetical protein